ncbi:MAG: helix-turn-helix domain-containing protein [Thermoguttaceae bacterium]
MANQEKAVSRLETATTRKSSAGNGGSDKQLLERLGRMVRVARVSRGLTQRELAARVERSQNLIWSVESGKKDPGLLLLSRIAKTLELPLTFFTVTIAEPRPNTVPDEHADFYDGRGLLMALAEGLDPRATESRESKSETKRKSRHS